MEKPGKNVCPLSEPTGLLTESLAITPHYFNTVMVFAFLLFEAG